NGVGRTQNFALGQSACFLPTTGDKGTSSGGPVRLERPRSTRRGARARRPQCRALAPCGADADQGSPLWLGGQRGGIASPPRPAGPGASPPPQCLGGAHLHRYSSWAAGQDGCADADANQTEPRERYASSEETMTQEEQRATWIENL